MLKNPRTTCQQLLCRLSRIKIRMSCVFQHPLAHLFLQRKDRAVASSAAPVPCYRFSDSDADARLAHQLCLRGDHRYGIVYLIGRKETYVEGIITGGFGRDRAGWNLPSNVCQSCKRLTKGVAPYRIEFSFPPSCPSLNDKRIFFVSGGNGRGGQTRRISEIAVPKRRGVRDQSVADKRKAIGELNRLIRNCKKCDLAQTRTHVLSGEGNLDARVMLVAQAPGEREDREGRMFIGPSGRILDELFDEGGVRREEVYMTNLIKCTLPKNRRPRQAEIEACVPFLEEEIAIVAPAVIAPLGYYAARFIFSRYSISAPEPRKEFSAVYGSLLLSQNKKIYPLPHPASLLYNNTFKPETLAKYRKLRVLSRECKWFPACPMKWFYDKGQLDRYWIERYCKGDWEECIRYQMEEQGRFHPDNMLPDGTLDDTLR